MLTAFPEFRFDEDFWEDPEKRSAAESVTSWLVDPSDLLDCSAEEIRDVLLGRSAALSRWRGLQGLTAQGLGRMYEDRPRPVGQLYQALILCVVEVGLNEQVAGFVLSGLDWMTPEQTVLVDDEVETARRQLLLLVAGLLPGLLEGLVRTRLAGIVAEAKSRWWHQWL